MLKYALILPSFIFQYKKYSRLRFRSAGASFVGSVFLLTFNPARVIRGFVLEQLRVKSEKLKV